MLGKFNCGFKPELSLAALALNMYMNSRFFTREEVESETAFAKNCWTHGIKCYQKRLLTETEVRTDARRGL